MIIVSQDKSTIVNFDNIVFLILQERAANISGEKETIIEALDKDLNEIVLAYYEEERAKEVLDEIAEQYEHEKDCKCDRSYLATLDNFTYRMPQE